MDSYSAFFDNNHVTQTNLAAELRSRRINDVYICGIAADYCAKFTAMDALELRFRTVIVEDTFIGISEEGCRKAREELSDAGGLFIHSSQVSFLFLLRY